MKAAKAAVLNPSLVKGFVAIACSLVFFSGAIQSASAALIFKIQDTTVISNGVSPTTGTLHGILQLTGADLAAPPNNVMSVNIAFQADPVQAQLTFSNPQEPTSGGLISGGNQFIGAPTDLSIDRIFFADDAVNTVSAFSNARLVSVPFSVAAGVTSAVYPVNFITSVPGGTLPNELGNSAAQAFPIQLMGGAITVRPIPEPSSIALALLASSLVCLRRRRR